MSDKGEINYRRYLNGEDEGLAEVIREYRNGLILFLTGITGSASAAEEAAEDVFVRLAVRRPRFRGESSFRTWLYAIGRNAARDRMRRQRDVLPLPGENGPDGDETLLERELLREETKIAVHRAMRRLNADYRQVLYLVFFEELSPADTARVMKKTKKQTANLLYRAKNALKKELEKGGFVYEDLR